MSYVGSNSGHRKVAAAMCSWIRDHAGMYGADGYVDIATGYFNLGGWVELVDDLEDVPSVRLLIGTAPDDLACFGRHDSGSDLTRAGWEMSVLRQFPEGLEHLKATPVQGVGRTRQVKALCAIASAAASGRLQVRQANNRTLMHVKLLIAGRQDGIGERMGKGVLTGSANITKSGLNDNDEFCISSEGDDQVNAAQRWFDSAFAQAVEIDLPERYLLAPDRIEPDTIRANTAYNAGHQWLLPGEQWHCGEMSFDGLSLDYGFGNGAMLQPSTMDFSMFLFRTSYKHCGIEEARWWRFILGTDDCHQLTADEAIKVIDRGRSPDDSTPRTIFPDRLWAPLWEAWQAVARRAEWNLAQQHGSKIIDSAQIKPEVFVAIR